MRRFNYLRNSNRAAFLFRPSSGLSLRHL
jgi:hypothetical protein